MKRCEGVRGRKVFNAMVVSGDEVYGFWLRDVDLLAIGKSDDSFFPMGASAEISTTLALLLALDLRGIDRRDLLLEKCLNRALDLDLVCSRGDAENVLVQLLGKEAGLLRHKDALDYIVCFFHCRAAVSLGGGCQEPQGLP